MEAVEPIRDKSKIVEVAEFLREWDLRYYLLFAVGIYTGLRISDVLGLRMGEVIHEYQSGRRRWAERLLIREKKTRKTHRERNILLKGTELGKIIKRDLKPIDQWNLNDWLLPSKRNRVGEERRPLSRWSAYHVLTAASDQCGLDGRIGTHTLRKTFGYHYYQHCKDVAALQNLFGHSSPAVTLRYIGITQDDHDTAYKTLHFGV